MKMVNVHEAKTNLSKLINRALAGEEIIIAKSNVPKVKLVTIKTRKKKRSLGNLKGLIKIARDFNEPLDDFKDYQ